MRTELGKNILYSINCNIDFIIRQFLCKGCLLEHWLSWPWSTSATACYHIYQEDMILLGLCQSFECFLQSVFAIYLSSLICNKLSDKWSAYEWIKCFYENFLKKSKKLKNLGLKGQKFAFLGIQTNFCLN